MSSPFAKCHSERTSPWWRFWNVTMVYVHDWNEWAGYDDGTGGTVMRSIAGTGCLGCEARYSPSREEAD